MPLSIRSLLLSFAVALLLFVPGCESQKDSDQVHQERAASSSATTLAEKEVDLGGIESKIPFPSEGTIGLTHEGDDFTSILFRPGLSFREAVAFFDESFPQHGWSVSAGGYRSEPDEDGEVTVEWNLEGHDKNLKVDLSAFGGWSAPNPRGSLVIR